MGDTPIYILTTLCLNGTLSCVEFMNVMGDIPIYNLTALCLNSVGHFQVLMSIRAGSHQTNAGSRVLTNTTTTTTALLPTYSQQDDDVHVCYHVESM